MSAVTMLATGFLVTAMGLYGLLRTAFTLLHQWEFSLVELLCGLVLMVMSLGGIACGLALCWIGGQA